MHPPSSVRRCALALAFATAALAQAAEEPRTSPRALEGDQGLVVVTITSPQRWLSREYRASSYGWAYFRNLRTGKRASVRAHPRPGYAIGSSTFVAQLPAGEWRLTSASFTITIYYTVGTVTMSQPVEVPVVIANLPTEFEVRAGELTDLGVVALAHDDKGLNLAPTPGKRAEPAPAPATGAEAAAQSAAQAEVDADPPPEKGVQRGKPVRSHAAFAPGHDPNILRFLALAYPRLAPVIAGPRHGWKATARDTSGWLQFRKRISLIGKPTRLDDGRYLVPMRFGGLWLWDGDAGIEWKEMGIGADILSVARLPDGRWSAISRDGSAWFAPTLDGPWQAMAPPSAETLRVVALLPGKGALHAITNEGVHWDPGFFEQQVWRARELVLWRQEPDGSWRALERFDAHEDKVGVATHGARAVFLVAGAVRVFDADEGFIAAGKFAAENVYVTGDGNFYALGDASVYATPGWVSVDGGRSWRQVADKKLPKEARVSPLMPTADGRIAFMGRARLRDIVPTFVLVSQGRDYARIGDSVERECRILNQVELIGSKLITTCAGDPALMILDLVSGEWREY